MIGTLKSPAQQSLVSRLGWFLVGGLISVAVNYAIFFAVHYQLHWPKDVALAVSLGVVTGVLSLWNYFVNFRTPRSFHKSLGRYISILLLCYALNYAITLFGLRHFGRTKLLEFSILAAVQVLISGVKFVLYHTWVYPRPS